VLDTTRRVATPEGIELTLRLAGPVARALAWTIDLAIRAGLLFAISMVAMYFGAAGVGVMLLAAFFLEWLLPAWFEAAWNGQTPGKKAMGLAVLNDDGTPLRWPAAFTRNLLRAVDFLPLAYGVGLVAMLANRDFKRLGDLAAGTVVVYAAEKTANERKIPEAAPVVPPVPLDLDEQRALLDLAERSQSLTQERFEELAELPQPLVGGLSGERAGTRLLGMASHIAGRQ
jgi:uncharacterized RDD family membrane protein YckC